MCGDSFESIDCVGDDGGDTCRIEFLSGVLLFVDVVAKRAPVLVIEYS